MFLKLGDTLELECRQSDNHNVVWRRGKNNDEGSPEEKLDNEFKGFKIRVYKRVVGGKTVTHSVLIKRNMTLDDEDSYMCHPESLPAQGTYIAVHLMESECLTRCCFKRGHTDVWLFYLFTYCMG